MRRKFFFILYVTLLTSVAALGQTTTPNIGLKIPNYAQPSWHIPVDYNWNKLDGAFSGQFAVPLILLSGPIVNDNQAATKAYVDAHSGGGGGSMVYPGVGIAQSAGTGWAPSLTAPGGAIVGTTDVQTLTNKTVDGVLPATFGFLDATSSIQGQLNAMAPLASPAFTGTPTAPTAASSTSTTQVATTAFVQALVSSTVNAYLPLIGGALTGPLTLNDGSLAASQAYVASAIGSSGGSTTNQVVASSVTSESAPGKICATVAGINGSVVCAGVQGTPTAITTQFGLNTPSAGTGTSNAVAQYGLTVNSSANTQVLWPTTIGSYDTASVFKREMWFQSGSNLPGLDNWEVDTYQFNQAAEIDFMLGWQCRRNASSPNTGSDFWQYDNFSHGWTNTAVPCSIVAGHVYHFVLMMHRDALTSTACSGMPCEYWDTFQLDDVTAGTSNTYTLNVSLPSEAATSGNGRLTWEGLGSQIQVDVVDSAATSSSPQLVSMYVDTDTLTAYTGGTGASVPASAGVLGSNSSSQFVVASSSAIAGALNASPTTTLATALFPALPYVANTITVNGHTLTSNATISASDLTTGTLPHAQLPTLLSADIPANAANTSGSAASLSAASALPSGTTAATQTAGDSSTKVATTAFVASAVMVYSNNGLALPTSSIAANTCTTVTGSPFAATGVTTSMEASFGWAGDPTGVVGYGSTGGLSVRVFPGSGTVGVTVCNPNSAAITPGAISINVRVRP